MDYHTVECGTVLYEQLSIVSHETYAVFSYYPPTPRKGATSLENPIHLVDLDFTHHIIHSHSTVEAIQVLEYVRIQREKIK